MGEFSVRCHVCIEWPPSILLHGNAHSERSNSDVSIYPWMITILFSVSDMKKIFPFELFHLGGDEVNTGWWKVFCPSGYFISVNLRLLLVVYLWPIAVVLLCKKIIHLMKKFPNIIGMTLSVEESYSWGIIFIYTDDGKTRKYYTSSRGN